MTIDGLNALTTLTAADEVPVWDSEESGEEPTKKITAQNMANSVKTLANLQGALTFDTTPTTGSTNPVTSGGVATAIQQSMAIAEESLTFTYNGKSVNIYFRTTGNVLSVLMAKEDSSMAIPTSWTNVGTLPTIRPASNRYIPLIASNGVIAIMRIYADGGVRIIATSSTAGWWQTSGTVIYK